MQWAPEAVLPIDGIWPFFLLYGEWPVAKETPDLVNRTVSRDLNPVNKITVLNEETFKINPFLRSIQIHC